MFRAVSSNFSFRHISFPNAHISSDPAISTQNSLNSLQGEKPSCYSKIINIFTTIKEALIGFFSNVFCCFRSKDFSNEASSPDSTSSSSSGSSSPDSTSSTPPSSPNREYHFSVGSTEVSLIRGDLLSQNVKAIVNAANEGCLGGGGIDGIIHRAAGPDLVAKCRDLPEVRPGVRCPTGDAVITTSGNLSSRGIEHVIHAVGPIHRPNDPNIAAQLKGAYLNSLKRAHEKNIPSLAFCLISGGIFGYPTEDSAGIAMETIQEYCEQNPNAFEKVKLVIIEQDKFDKAYNALKEIVSFE